MSYMCGLSRMKLSMSEVTLFLVIASCLVVVEAVTLFPYDTATSLLVVDDTLEEHSLNMPVYFHGSSYVTLYISENGMVTFNNNFYGGINFPLNMKWIAPFGADVVPYVGGTLSYEMFETFNHPVWTRAEDLVVEVFPDDTVQASAVTVITWLKVKNSSTSAAENTFQLALLTDSRGKSYAIFLYEQIEWYPAVIGASAGDSSSVYRVCDTDKYGTTFLPIKSNNQCGSGGVIVLRLHETTWNQPTYTCTSVYTAISCRLKPGIPDANRDKRCSSD